MAGTLCGHSDPPLNALGRAQAASVVQLLSRVQIGKLYTSDLLRALQTAEFVSSTFKIPMTSRADLREMFFGAWEGKRWSEIRASLGIQSLESSPEVCAPGGESYSSFRERGVRALKEIIAGLGDGPTVVITHMGVIRIAITEMTTSFAEACEEQRIEPCGVYRFVANGHSLTFTGQLTPA
jgi:broad specificity phosphatase PhoE